MDVNERIVVYCCQNSAWKAVGKALEEGIELPDTVHFIPVPCLERVNLELILRTEEDTTKAILILGCGNGSCSNLYGNERARVRVAEAKKILSKNGPTKLRIESHETNAEDFSCLIELLTNIDCE